MLLGIFPVNNQLDVQFFFLICLFQFSTCCGQPFAHHQESQLYQYDIWYNWLSWWWAHGCSKHVENWNKHIRKKICASSWLFTSNTICALFWFKNAQVSATVSSCLQTFILSGLKLDAAPVWCVLFGVYWETVWIDVCKLKLTEAEKSASSKSDICLTVDHWYK